MDQATAHRIHEIPPPPAKEPGWYPDPLGSTAERYWDRTWLELTRVPKVRPAAPIVDPVPNANGNGHHGKRGLRFPLSLVGFKSPEVEPPRPADKGSRKQLKEKDERKREFFESPAGKARLSFGQDHKLFQCHLALTRPEPFVIPGIEGGSPFITSDPVHVLNSVVVEGWKLKEGTFFWADSWGGIVGFYLFRRSKKQHRKMNDPWKSEPQELS